MGDLFFAIGDQISTLGVTCPKSDRWYDPDHDREIIKKIIGDQFMIADHQPVYIFYLLYHYIIKHKGVSNASYMVFSTHVNVSMFEVKIPLKQNMRMKFNEVDWMAENHSKR